MRINQQYCGSGSGTGSENFGHIRVRSGTDMNVTELRKGSLFKFEDEAA
jgi:hypothetical protein